MPSGGSDGVTRRRPQSSAFACLACLLPRRPLPSAVAWRGPMPFKPRPAAILTPPIPTASQCRTSRTSRSRRPPPPPRTPRCSPSPCSCSPPLRARLASRCASCLKTARAEPRRSTGLPPRRPWARGTGAAGVLRLRPAGAGRRPELRGRGGRFSCRRGGPAAARGAGAGVGGAPGARDAGPGRRVGQVPRTGARLVGGLLRALCWHRVRRYQAPHGR